MTTYGESVTRPGRIMTHTGLYFDFGDPRPEMFRLEDVAHALAILPRFQGHTPKPYSIAQHSVLCSFLAPDSLRLEALMHDAHEAYVGDMPRPLKALLPGYQAIERRCEIALRRRFGLPIDLDPRVKEIDRRILVTEARAFDKAWWPDAGLDPYVLDVTPWPWHKAKMKFLARARALGLD